LFFATKNDISHAFKRLAKMFEKEKSFKIVSIRSDHGGNFKMKGLNTFVKSKALSIIFLHQEPHNKIVLLKGKIGHLRNYLQLC